MSGKGQENFENTHSTKSNSPSQKWITVDRIIELSNKFPVPYSKKLTSMKCITLKEKFGTETIENNLNSAYPVIHENVLKLYENFLHMNRNDDFYKNMTVANFVDRLLKKRAVSFLVGSGFSAIFTDCQCEEGKNVDFHIERTTVSKDGSTEIYFAKGGWETIGTAAEKFPLTRNNCLTYDEIELSSFLSVSSFTIFVNTGSRHNMGVYEKDRKKVQDQGIIIGLIGPQFEKPGVMEYKRMVSCGTENLADDRMGKLMKEFYDCSNSKLLILKNKYFNISVYKKRLAISFDTLLIEANHRARKVNEMAFIHVVGIGLGVWRFCDEQLGIFVDTFYERLEELGSQLKNVSDVRLAYISVAANKRRKKVGEISIHFENVDPHIRIEKGKLLVVSYTWDGNALPGNEFWQGFLCGSSDPAAACSTQITELHNAHINENVCGENLHIATADTGIISYKELLEK